MRKLATTLRNTLPPTQRRFTAWSGVALGPPDAILGLSGAFKSDTSPKKVNLGVGVYRDGANKPYILECIKTASSTFAYQDMEYAPITGLPSFVKNAQLLAFGDGATGLDRVASTQTLSGTGALRIAGESLRRFGAKKIVVPNPTWGNHTNIFRDAGLEVGTYTYYDAKKKAINLEGLLADLDKAAEGTVVLLHACAHNPTGLDPTPAEWERVFAVIQQRKLLPLVDMAYQGFASGDVDRDAYVLRQLFAKVPNMIVCQSFAKNFGLYGQRVGAAHFVCEDAAEAERVLSQVKIVIRPMYSNPPLHGALLADHVMNNSELKQQWRKELQAMADRMNNIRGRLVQELGAAGSQLDWSHLNKQIGMMAFTGLSKAQVATLKADHHIYMTDDGRAAISGLNETNVQYVAQAFHAVTK